MLGQIVGAQFALEHAIAELTRSAAGSLALAQSNGELQSLMLLRREVGSAGPTMLAALHAQVAATVAAAQSVAEQGQATAARAESAELSHLAAESRDQVTSLMRDMHRFDPYLRFASTEDQEAYRRREAERRTYIETQQARGTPEGDLNAANAALTQLRDAGAHGASRSPEYAERYSGLAASTERLRHAVGPAAGTSADRDPNVPTSAPAIRAPTTSSVAASDVDDAMQALRAAGVSSASTPLAEATAHGLSSSTAASAGRAATSGRA